MLPEPATLDVFVARQPIYDGQLEVYAYELLFRDEDSPRAHVEDGEFATSNVLLNTFTEIGLDNVVGQRSAYINVSYRFLLENPLLELPPDRIVLEVLEDTEPDEALLNALRRLSARGHVIALDDFVYGEARQALMEVADVVKVDVLALGRTGVEEQLRLLAPYDVKLLAEKVETYEDFEYCKALGFDLFQGYFFCRPKVIRARGLPANRLLTLRLVAALQQTDVDFDDLEEIVSRDVGLSYRLLRYINSAFFSLPREITSTRQALTLLGVENIRRWTTLLTLAGVPDKPHELITTALVRAQFCERLAPAFHESDAEGLFTLGLFSVIDAMMDAPMAEVLATLPFSEEIKRALVGQEGRKGRVLRCVLACERGDVDQARVLLPDQPLGALYLEAVAWADEASAALA